MDSIALKMLFGDRLKYLGLVAGVAFAAMLITQQLSILVGLTNQTGAFVRDTSHADLWVMDPQVRFSQDSLPIRETVLQQARGVAGVEWAVPLFQGFVSGRMADGTRFTMILVGIDDATLLGAPPEMVEGTLADLRRDRGVLIDAVSAPDKLAMRNGGGRTVRVGDRLSINDHEAIVVGSYRARRSFFWEPVVYTTYSRALQFSPPARNKLNFVLVKVRADADLRRVQRDLERQTGLTVRTNDEFLELTADYILYSTGIIVSFGIAVALGFVIGTLVAGQTLYNFTLDNLRHYGALKAMGVSNARLTRMVLLQALTVALTGYGIGVGAGAALGYAVGQAGLAFAMPWQIPAFTGVSILAICLMASVVSLWRVYRLEPGIVFRG